MNSPCFNTLPIAISLLVVLAPSFVTTHWATTQTTVLQSDAVPSEVVTDLADQFLAPPKNAYPETWFHLIGGNVNREALTTDLEAVADARISGIQLFHGPVHSDASGNGHVRGFLGDYHIRATDCGRTATTRVKLQREGSQILLQLK